jgi:general nucleoside transport system ATP-binding protein
MPLLEMKNICRKFSGSYANNNISLTVEQGEIHALLGENGAGKTTLVNILFGLYTADGGEIRWKGQPVSFNSPKDAIAAGIGMVQQHFSLIRKMSVLDNIILNCPENRFFLNRAGMKKRVVCLSEKYGLSVDPDARISALSVGEQQRVEILKALFRNAELLILDEPTGILTPQETARLFEILRNLKNEGYGIIIITHRMSEIMAVSDCVTVLRDGEKVADFKTSETNPHELSHCMIGRDVKENERLLFSVPDGNMLVVRHVSLRHAEHSLYDISLYVRKGEILGIAGVEGNGQKELAEVITGIRKNDGGTIELDGLNISNTSVKQRYRAGITYISDDRQNDSLLMNMDITANLMIRNYDSFPYSRCGIICSRETGQSAVHKMSEYQVKTTGQSGPHTIVKLMSGGNQQKLVIAREVTDAARLIVACQPTRGLDIGASEFVREQLLEQKRRQKSIMLISADLEEILALCDRIAVLFAGRIVGILDRDGADAEKIGLLMGGITGSA